ncbi:hypothetical protein D3C86_2071320 [compost metagenome]
MLFTSMVMSALPLSALAGSKLTLAANFLKLPDTGTPLCFMVNTSWLLPRSTFWANTGLASSRPAEINRAFIGAFVLRVNDAGSCAAADHHGQ